MKNNKLFNESLNATYAQVKGLMNQLDEGGKQRVVQALKESTQINEVDPRNFDSDIDYYNALNKPARGRSEDDYVEPGSDYDEPIKFKQDPNARPQYSVSKDEDRQAGYNMTLTVKAPTTQKAQWAAESYVDSEWGAKKQVGKITPVADGVVQVHMIDNHKYGMWKPWKDEDPISKPISFNEEQLDELSPETLASYKKKAGAQASELDKQAWAGQQPTQQRIEKANKRYSGIIGATKRELGIKEDAEELNFGDPVVVTGDVQFNGATGDIVGFSNDKHFVIVDLYNHGKRSFHSSDVSFNDYADSDDEQEYMDNMREDDTQSVDTDQILQYLTKAARSMNDHKDSFSPEGWDRIKRSYDFMRSYLKDGDYEGFLSAYNETLRSHPDSAGLLIDEMFTAAGLDENATIEDFLAKVSSVEEGKVKDALIKGTYGKPASEKTRSSGMFSGIVNARNSIEKSKNSQRPNYNKVCDMCKRAGDSCVCEDMPPPENARKTQIAGTLPTYKKAADILNKTGVQGKALDFGAGLGMGTGELGPDAHSYEPFPNEKFKPHFVDVTKIPDNSYHKIVNLNVLNVVPNTGEHKIRDSIVKNIGRVLAPGGVALITTRGKDVLTIKGTPGEEPTSMISKIGTYQKGFTQKELLQYIQQTLGKGFEVSSIKLGPAGVMIKKLDQEGVAEGSNDKPEAGDKIIWYHSNHYPKLEGEVVGWKDGHLIVKSIDPSPRNTEKTVATYRVPKNNILSVAKQGVAEAEGEAKPVNMKRWLRDFERREDNNFHTENVLAMAQLVGTPEDVATMKKLVKLHRGFGLGEKEFTIRQAIADRLRPLVKQKIADSQAQNLDEEELDEECWKGYEQYGMKEKNGKKVPNCVPVKETKSNILKGLM